MQNQVNNYDARQLNMALAGAMIVAVSYGWGRYNYGLYLPEIRQSFQLSLFWLGLIGSLSYGGYFLATLFTSLWAARLGPKLLIGIGGLCASAGMLLVAIADNVVVLTLGLAIAGMSPGLCYTPLSDVVVRCYSRRQQGNAYALMNTGTSFGVILAGPLALWWADEWRAAWLLFAGLALLITLWNWFCMPGRGTDSTLSSPQQQALLPPKQWLQQYRYLQVFMAAFLMGVASSVYWTFATDLLHQAGSSVSSSLFWVILGVAGCAGVVAGAMVQRLGLQRALWLIVILQALSMWGLAYGADNYLLALGSSGLFGGSFVILSAFMGIWAMRRFAERASTGFGLVFLVMSVGQFAGPFLTGAWAEIYGLPSAFGLGGVLVLLVALLGMERRKDYEFAPAATSSCP